MRKLMTVPFVLAVILCGCSATPAASSGAAPERLKPQILEVLPHDPTAFTEGLELAGGVLYESTGLQGQSRVQAGPPGQPPTKRADLASPMFGEGITVLGPTLWQLTWKDGVAIERDSATLAERRRVTYSGEGWGLCHQPERDRLVMSNGTGRLTFRDPRSFAETGGVDVGYDQLNELECVGDTVCINVWQTDTILRFDLGAGRVTGMIDAAGLLSPAERASADVLNGIAAVPGTDQFLVTGKLWPKVFRVKFVPSS